MKSLITCPVIGWKGPVTGHYFNTSAVPPHVHAYFKLTSLFFLLWYQWLTWNLDCCRKATYEDTLHTWELRILLLQVFEYVRTSQDQPPKLHERTVTKTNAITKSAENTSFCNYSSFLLFLYISQNINLFFNQIVALFLLSHLVLQ